MNLVTGSIEGAFSRARYACHPAISDFRWTNCCHKQSGHLLQTLYLRFLLLKILSPKLFFFCWQFKLALLIWFWRGCVKCPTVPCPLYVLMLTWSQSQCWEGVLQGRMQTQGRACLSFRLLTWASVIWSDMNIAKNLGKLPVPQKWPISGEYSSTPS